MSCSCTRSPPPWRPTTLSPCESSAPQKGSKPTSAHRLRLIIDNQSNLVSDHQIKEVNQKSKTIYLFFLWPSPLNLIFWRNSAAESVVKSLKRVKSRVRWKLSQISGMQLCNHYWLKLKTKAVSSILELFKKSNFLHTLVCVAGIVFNFEIYYDCIYWTTECVWHFA